MGAFSHLQQSYDNTFNINVSLPPLNSSIFAQDGMLSNNFLLKGNNPPPIKKKSDVNDM